MTGTAGVQIKLGTQPLIVVYRRGERAGKIQIAFHRDGPHNLIFRVSDDGVEFFAVSTFNFFPSCSSYYYP